MKHLTSKHEFALYWHEVTTVLNRVGMPVEIKHEGLVHRIAQVLRLEQGDQCILFDRSHHATVTIVKITKKNIAILVDALAANQIIKPSITFLLPLLKRESLETAIYSLVELGATTIQLVQTDKVQRKWAGAAEFERLQKIMIAAAEQSKHYAFAQLLEPITLEQAMNKFCEQQVECVYADPQGAPLQDVMKKIYEKPLSKLVLMVGPEGDLQQSEKDFLHQHNFIFCQLTPTVIRACQAAGVMLGIFRSILK